MRDSKSSLHLVHAYGEPVKGMPVQHNAEVVQALKDTLDCLHLMDHKHRIICRHDGLVIAADDGIDEFLAELRSLAIHSGRVIAEQSKSAVALRKALSVNDPEVFTTLIPTTDGIGHFILRAAQFDHDLICLCMCRSTDDQQSTLPNLGEAFGLTPSEAAIVTEIFNGKTPQQAAHNYGISIHTVRAHLRHCYGKLDVNSREELWQKLRGYCIT